MIPIKSPPTTTSTPIDEKKSKGRPIHAPPREVYDKPSESEPPLGNSFQDETGSHFFIHDFTPGSKKGGGGVSIHQGKSMHHSKSWHSNNNSNNNNTCTGGSSGLDVGSIKRNIYKNSYSENDIQSNLLLPVNKPTANDYLKQKTEMKKKNKQRTMERDNGRNFKMSSFDDLLDIGNTNHQLDFQNSYSSLSCGDEDQYQLSASSLDIHDIYNTQHNDEDDDDGNGFIQNRGYDRNKSCIDISTRSLPVCTTNQLKTSSTSGGKFTFTSDQKIEDIYEQSAASFDKYLIKHRKIQDLIDSCNDQQDVEKKKVFLSGMELSADYIEFFVDQISTRTLLSQSLHKLCCARNPLHRIPENLVHNMKGLHILNMSQCSIKSLPDDWSLPNLKRLNLSHNELEDFPNIDFFNGLPSLKVLNLYGNNIKEIIIEESFTHPNLNHINLGFNDLHQIPDEITKFTALQTLELMNNYLTVIPQSLCTLQRLEVLEISYNPISQPPIEICELGIASIRRYYKSMNKPKPRKKSLTRNKSRNNDNGTSGTTRTRRKGTPTKLTSTIGRTLSSPFPSSPTPSIVEEIFGDQEIQTHLELDISSTMSMNSSSLPIQEDELHENTLNQSQSFPQSQVRDMRQVISVGCKKIETDEVERTFNDTLKIIFVGSAMAGKTTIIKRLTKREKAVIPTEKDRTIGVEIKKWIPKDYGYDTNVKFSMWDFAGQQIYHSTHELFFSNRALYIVVWDLAAENLDTFHTDQDSCSDDSNQFADIPEEEETKIALLKDIDEKVQFWVDCIQSSAPGAAILIIASHSDKFESDQEKLNRCNILKQRLMENENGQVEGLRQKLEEFKYQRNVGSNTANRVQQLLSARPKLLFSGKDNHVLSVSGTNFNGFDELSRTIIDIATNPTIFSSIGSEIPNHFCKVRDTIQIIKKKFYVVEWSYFFDNLRHEYSEEEVSDALRFLANKGEILYFASKEKLKEELHVNDNSVAFLSKKDVPAHLFPQPLSEKQHRSSSLSSVSSSYATLISTYPSDSDELSKYIFLNPKWLMSAIKKVLRHDIIDQIKYIWKGRRDFERTGFCPVVYQNEIRQLWKEADELWQKVPKRELNETGQTHIFTFLEKLLTRFRVFVPIDLSIDEAILEGVSYQSQEMPVSPNAYASASAYFLPSLLGKNKPPDELLHVTYKGNEKRKEVVCHSFLFPNGVPPTVMEYVMASVLSSVYDMGEVTSGDSGSIHKPKLTQIVCYRDAFSVIISLFNPDTKTKNLVEILVHLIDADSKFFLAQEINHRKKVRINICGKGYPSLIWQGGYSEVLKAVRQVFSEKYVGLEYEEQVFCNKCMAQGDLSINEVDVWDLSFFINSIEENGSLKCRNWHEINNSDLCFIAGPDYCNQQKGSFRLEKSKQEDEEDEVVKLMKNCLNSVVLIGLWSNEQQKMISIGSGFIVDSRQGLVFTAAHVLMNLESDNFGLNYFGMKKKESKIYIGVIPQPDEQNKQYSYSAIFRYTAEIFGKDKKIEDSDFCEVDGCLLKITTRLERDVTDLSDFAYQICDKLVNLGEENLPRLRMIKSSDLLELGSRVYVFGYTQEKLSISKGIGCNKSLGYVKGQLRTIHDAERVRKREYCPCSEIEIVTKVVPTSGYSGGPCLNLKGEVIGIMTRTDPLDSHRNFIVPVKELKKLSGTENLNKRSATRRKYCKF